MSQNLPDSILPLSSPAIAEVNSLIHQVQRITKCERHEASRLVADWIVERKFDDPDLSPSTLRSQLRFLRRREAGYV